MYVCMYLCIYRQTARQAGRQKDRQIHIHIHRHRHIHIHIHYIYGISHLYIYTCIWYYRSYPRVNVHIDVQNPWFPIRKAPFRSRQSSSSSEATAAAGTLPGHLGLCQAPNFATQKKVKSSPMKNR